MLTAHQFAVAGGAMLSHEWIAPGSNSAAPDVALLYGDMPLTTATKYTASVSGTGADGGAVAIMTTFTTM